MRVNKAFAYPGFTRVTLLRSASGFLRAIKRIYDTPDDATPLALFCSQSRSEASMLCRTACRPSGFRHKRQAGVLYQKQKKLDLDKEINNI